MKWYTLCYTMINISFTFKKRFLKNAPDFFFFFLWISNEFYLQVAIVVLLECILGNEVKWCCCGPHVWSWLLIPWLCRIFPWFAFWNYNNLPALWPFAFARISAFASFFAAVSPQIFFFQINKTREVTASGWWGITKAFIRAEIMWRVVHNTEDKLAVALWNVWP